MSDRLKALADAGVSIWLDDLSRERIETGNLAELVKKKSVVGVTTNPTIFAARDRRRRAVRRPGRPARRRRASPWTGSSSSSPPRTSATPATSSRRSPTSTPSDGRVSIEVEPDLANDTEGTIASARALWQAVDRPNVLIKIPATKEGLPAITAAIAEGISVNVTLIFGLERYREVMDAYLTGLEQARDAGLDLGRIQSVASFFVSRVDTEVDKRLEAIGTDEAAGARGQGRHRQRPARLRGVRGGRRPATAGRCSPTPAPTAQRPLWASTGVKNQAYPDTLYVTELVVADTVNTMPEKTMEAFADHGEVKGDTVTGTRRRGPGGLRPARRASASTSTTCCWCSSTRASTSSRSRGTELVDSTGQMDRPRWRRQDRTGHERDSLEHRERRSGPERRSSCSSATPTRRPSPAPSSSWSTDQVASRHRRPGPDPVGSGRRGRGRQAARAGSPSRRPRVRWSPTSPRSQVELREQRPDPGRALRHGRLVAGARGDLRGRRRRARRPRLLRPGLRAHRARGPARRDRGRGLQQVRRHRRDRQPEAGLREGVHRRRHRARRADRRRHRPRLAAGEGGPRGRLPRVPRRPRRRRPLLRAHRLRPGAERAGRRRHRRRCSTRPRRSVPPSRPTRSTTRACASGGLLGAANLAGVDKLVLANAGAAYAGFGDWAEQLIAESTGKDGKGILPVVVDALDSPNFDPSTPDEVLATFGPDRSSSASDAAPRLRLGRLASTRRWAPSCCCGSTPPRSPAGSSASTRSTSPTSRAPRHAAREMLDGGGRLAHAAVRRRAGHGLRLRGLAARGHRHGGRRGGGAARRARPASTATSSVQAYLDRHRDAALASVRDALAVRTGRPVTFGWGPRFLHSTGQYHKGGPATGVYLQVTGEPEADLAVPDRPFTFQEFLTAQAVGDGQVLAQHGPAGPAAARQQPRRPRRRTQRPRWAGVTYTNPLRDPRGPPAAPHRRPLRHGALRRHRRPVAQEGDAGDLRPGQPRPAAARLQPGRLRPPRLGRPGLRADRARLGEGARPHRVPRGGLAAARRGLPLRPGQLRRRRRPSTACAAPSRSSTRSAAPAATTPSTSRSRRASSATSSAS